MLLFTAKDVTSGYGGKTIIEQVSLQVESGQIVGILGANGSGKSTLLKSVCNILPHEGKCILKRDSTKPDELEFEKLSARELAQICSYIPQRSGISIDISVLDVVLMGFNPHLRLFEYPTLKMKNAARKTLDAVGLKGKEGINYLHLSEGQKQLCILARTLVTDANLLLLDEPESALDFRFRYHMMEILQNWLREGVRGALVTLHDPTIALNYCDKLVLLSEGKIKGTIFPKKDSMETMEEKLSEIYGPVSLCICQNKAGQKQLLMMKEPEFMLGENTR